MPSAVQPLGLAARTWSSATRRSKSRAMPRPGRRLRSDLSRGSGDRSDLLVGGDPVERFGRHRRIADVASGNLPPGDRVAITCRQWMARICGVCPSMPMWILRHGRRFGPPCPRAFHSPSPSASMPVPSTARQGIAQQCPRGDRKVQRALRTTTGDVHGRGLPASAHGAEVRHGPVRADQAQEAQEALDEAGRLAKGHAGKDLHPFRDITSRYPAGQRSGLSGSPRHRPQAADRACRSVAAPGPFPHRTDLLGHCRAMPCRSVDRREPALLERSVAGRPGPGPKLGGVGLPMHHRHHAGSTR